MEAGDALARFIGQDEEYMWLNQIEEEAERQFVAEHYPTVASRLSIAIIDAP